MNEWLHQHAAALGWLAALSAVLFIAGVIAVPMLVVRMPADYFVRARPSERPWARLHPLVRAGLLGVKNLLGCLLVAAGVLMLVLPGQGVLAILAGIMLLDFPGKHGLERAIVSRPLVLRSINWLRRRDGRPPLVLDT